MKKPRKKTPEKNRFNTGGDLLDIVVGGDKNVFGYPAGRVINIVGDKSTGKTFLACELIASAYYKYGKKFKWVYDDAESGFTFNTKSLYGFDIINDDAPRSNTVEDLYCNYRKFLETIKKDECGIYVIDSLDGLSSDEILNRSDDRYKKWNEGKNFDKGSYQMGAAKFLSQEFFRGLAGESYNKKCLLVIISQVRDNIDPFSFKKHKRGGGKALDHYCHTVLWLANSKKIKIKDRIVGVVIKAKLDKSKTPRPYRECIFPILFDYGIDNTGANLDYLFDLRTDKGELRTKQISWDGGNQDKLTSKVLRDFMKEFGIEKEWNEFKKNNQVKRKEGMINFIKEHAGKEFEKRFSLSNLKSRKQMIQWIEDKNKKDELRRRVVEKWEQIEDSIKTTRLKKYK
jgi:recombination protein RecA